MWKQLDDFPNYEVSDKGEVRNIKTQRVLKPWLNSGYYKVDLCGNNLLLHRLVATAFLGADLGECVRHIDGDTSNNCLSNLAWGSLQENQLDRTHTTMGFKLNPRKVRIIRGLHKCGFTYKRLSELFSVSTNTIGLVIRRQTWTCIA